MNGWTECGLYNGAMGTIVDKVYADKMPPPLLPVGVIVKFEDYAVPPLVAIPKCDPICPLTVSYIVHNELQERQQLPRKLSLWAEALL
eukprot:gene1560-1720_t